jgi:hypothetical protein
MPIDWPAGKTLYLRDPSHPAVLVCELALAEPVAHESGDVDPRFAVRLKNDEVGRVVREVRERRVELEQSGLVR